MERSARCSSALPTTRPDAGTEARLRQRLRLQRRHRGKRGSRP
ncbi:hypothetical protein ACFPRL_26830 [Pseudoclavibacter helvolus]